METLVLNQQYDEALKVAFNDMRVFHTLIDIINDPDQLKLQAFYYLFLAYMTLGYEDRGVPIGEVVGPLVSDYDPLIFEQFHQIAQPEIEKQRNAVRDGKPSILVAALHKSASATLSNALREMLDLALVRLQFNDVILPHLARNFAVGGCVTHSHFPATEHNIRTLREAGLDQIFVQIRDPRAVAYSWVHYFQKFIKIPQNPLAGDVGQDDADNGEATIFEFFTSAVKWLDGWAAFVEAETQGLTVHFVDFEDISQDFEGVLTKILEHTQFPDGASYLERWIAGGGLEKKLNFRKGQSDDWRTVLAPEVRTRLCKMTPERVKNLFSDYRE